MATNNSRSLKFRVREFLPALKARETTNRDVAAHLGCSEEALCRVLKGVGLKKEPAVDRKAKTELNRERKKFRILTANDPANTPEDAAKLCNVSVRTIYRYIGKTLSDDTGD